MKNQIMAIALGFCLTLMADTQASYAEKELPTPAQLYVGVLAGLDCALGMTG